MTTEQTIQRVGELTKECWTYHEIAIELGITDDEVIQFRRLRLMNGPAPTPPPPEPVAKPASRQPAPKYLPTRKAIRRECREIRKTWSARERVLRYYLARVDGLSLNFSQVREMQAVRIHKDVKLAELVA